MTAPKPVNRFTRQAHRHAKSWRAIQRAAILAGFPGSGPEAGDALLEAVAANAVTLSVSRK